MYLRCRLYPLVTRPLRELKATIERVIEQKEQEQQAKRASAPSAETLRIRQCLVDAVAEVVDSYRTHRQDVGINASGGLVHEFLEPHACQVFLEATEALARLVHAHHHPLRRHFVVNMLPMLADSARARVLREPPPCERYAHFSDDQLYDELDCQIHVLSRLDVAAISFAAPDTAA